MKRITTGEVDMNEVAMLQGAEPRRILQSVLEKKVPAILTYLSRGKWHVAKVQVTDIGACSLNARIFRTKKPHPLNIRVDQPVGLSLKYGYGKLIFETKVIALEPSFDGGSGGTLVLEVPGRIQVVQRRSYFRVDVPKSLKVNVLLWHRGQEGRSGDGKAARSEHDGGEQVLPGRYWQGRLVDISAGGAQVVINAEHEQEFRNGQFIGLRFTPLPYERPLMFSGQIRNMLPTADGKNICLGAQIVGLEASSEGRQVLERLCGIVERYHQINQSSVKQQDFQAEPKVTDAAF
ncbi:MAG: PilZ domain-containing protein [Planctomycetota bacterium]